MQHCTYSESVPVVDCTQQTQRFRVLALDGGGIRGVCTAAYLARLEESIGHPIHRYFDLICGTSVGGIIAVALALGVPIAEVLDMLRYRATSVFQRRHPLMWKWLAMSKDSLYRSGLLHDLLRDILGPDTTIGQAKCRLCIPAVNITTGRATVFKTRHATDLERDCKLEAWRVAAATAAAPIYFSPVAIPDCGDFVDGGLWANTPGSVGILEGLRLGKELKEIDLLSIGTGSWTFQRSSKRRQRWLHRIGCAKDGLLGWGTDLVALSMHVQTDRGENFMEYLLRDQHPVRVQFPLPPNGFDLDAVDKVETLVEIAFEEAKRSAHTVRNSFFQEVVTPFEPLP